MLNAYKGYHFKMSPKEPASEILIAELSERGFDSFVETEEGLSAYIQTELWVPNVLEDIYILESGEFDITTEIEDVEQVNWNEEWEKNFHPIVVDDTCVVRAPFHDETAVAYEIVIEPKMSFGTGHHETTFMMIKHLLQMNVENNRVLDMGCGTGVLAILAAMKGATLVDAIDIDNWCYLNSIENCERNNCADINVFEGDKQVLEDRKQTYDVIIANINRNILLDDISTYTKYLAKGGTLLLSGFYSEDLPMITECCEGEGLKFAENFEKNNWIAAKYVN
ncbi:50S ribosomal protein L11 methyltransferase [Neptunitalea lumnitzerae]|uniref:Ribosomal protein L11 methyltransferase n=1 Tax=Neptunitalea lumnitzerae TaxID=2965509 RepID=A0ABQ5MMD8_9FLAO|nr:50S ribosomal protein L11 methyltransferase [Neptunitalea sp. Y10]GLB50571.1 ribosomal protein L11 methyltransferase [Neptunitalea sp. Y10]